MLISKALKDRQIQEVKAKPHHGWSIDKFQTFLHSFSQVWVFGIDLTRTARQH